MLDNSLLRMFPPYSQLALGIKVGATYRHYKGGLYKVLMLFRSATDLLKDAEEMVSYQSLQDQEVWGSTVREFAGYVCLPFDDVRPRFTLVEGADQSLVQ